MHRGVFFIKQCIALSWSNIFYVSCVTRSTRTAEGKWKVFGNLWTIIFKLKFTSCVMFFFFSAVHERMAMPFCWNKKLSWLYFIHTPYWHLVYLQVNTNCANCPTIGTWSTLKTYVACGVHTKTKMTYIWEYEVIHTSQAARHFCFCFNILGHSWPCYCTYIRKTWCGVLKVRVNKYRGIHVVSVTAAYMCLCVGWVAPV